MLFLQMSWTPAAWARFQKSGMMASLHVRVPGSDYCSSILKFCKCAKKEWRGKQVPPVCSLLYISVSVLSVRHRLLPGCSLCCGKQLSVFFWSGLTCVCLEVDCLWVMQNQNDMWQMLPLKAHLYIIYPNLDYTNFSVADCLYDIKLCKLLHF